MASILPSERDTKRFQSFVSPEPNSGCWLWTGAYVNSGYGVFRAGSLSNGTRRNVLAHRFAIEATGRVFAEGEMALHKCDNKACVNPSHLYVGDRKDNARDAIRSGKCKGNSMPGAKNPNRKLTEDQVRFILRNASKPHIQLARMFGVSDTSIAYIKSRKTWRVLNAV